MSQTNILLSVFNRDMNSDQGKMKELIAFAVLILAIIEKVYSKRSF